ncbi:FG-GAP repeat protein [Verrucomicrobium spinosum]|uniref:FG-GAP repeat protein n=1 Tax=Verrucomicrobium spinosum TaxID=2736 RepID=UPI001E5031E9|nr:FG-GAP repeat protein [Verrucomicrobium spinosum]
MSPRLVCAQGTDFYWNPVVIRIGSTLPAGSIDAATTPGVRTLSTNAAGFGALPSSSESLLFASVPSSSSGAIAWTAPDSSGSVMTAGSVAGVMLRFSETTAPGAPFVFAGVRQGVSGVELRWRLVQNGEMKSVSGVISGTDFPPGSKLKLEAIAGRAFLSYKMSSDLPTDPWRKRVAIDFTGSGSVRSGLVLATGGSGTASLSVNNDHVQVWPMKEGAHWVRLVEPFDPGYGGDRISTRESMFGWEDWSFESTVDVETGPAAQIYSGGDYWKWSREASAWTIDPDLEDRVTVYMTDIHPTTASEDATDVYVRYGAITSHTASPSVDSLIWDGESVLSSHPVAGVLGEGLWVFLATLPKPVYADTSLQLIMGWTFTQTPGGLKNEASLDGLLLVGQGPQTDSNGDGLPDEFGGLFAPWLTSDGDFDGDGLTNAEEYVLGLSPTTSSSGVPPTVSVVKPGSSPWLLARGRWSATPAEVKAVYPGTSPPVPIKGYGFYLKTSENTIGFGSSRNAAAWKGDYLTTTDSLGVARAYLWVDAECPTPAGSSSTGYDINVRDFYASFKVRPYDNTSPGPIDILGAAQYRLTPSTFMSLSSSTFSLLGEWLISADTTGANLWRWSPWDNSWSSRPGLFSGLSMSSITGDSDTFVVSGNQVHTGIYDAGQEVWSTWGTAFSPTVPVQPTQPVGYTPRTGDYEWASQLGFINLYQGFPRALALRGGWLAVGQADWNGTVELYKKEGSGWSLHSTLAPSSGSHSDTFGYSVAFSEDGQRLVVGAPGDARGHAAGMYALSYLPTILIDVPHTEDVWGWGEDEFGNPIWTVIGQNTWNEVTVGMTSGSPPPSAQPSAYVYELDPNDDWNQVARLVSSTTGPSVTYDLEMFGASVAAVNNWVIVGAPYFNEGADIPTSEPLPQGSVYGFKHDGTAWVQQDVVRRSNPRFGEKVLASGDRVLAVTPPTSYPIEQAALPGYAAVLHPGNTDLNPVGEIANPYSAPSSAADESTFVSKTSATTAQEYLWLPAVPWDATEGTAKVGWLTVTDEDLANANASLEQISLLAGDSLRWLLDTSLSQPGAPAHEAWQSEPKALKVKLGADLESFAPGIDWLEVTALDRAGDAYTEYLGIRVTGQAPSVPVLQSVSGAGGRQVRVAWSASSHSPATYVVETADHAVIEDLLSNGGTPQQISDAFSERARVMGSQTSYYHQVATPGDVYTLKLAFRVRALNEEGLSDPSNYIIANLDEDDDGLPDWWEALHGGDLDPTLDDDSDGLTNLQEYAAGTNPMVADSDGDGTLDGADSEPLNAKVNSLSFVLFTPVE